MKKTRCPRPGCNRWSFKNKGLCDSCYSSVYHYHKKYHMSTSTAELYVTHTPKYHHVKNSKHIQNQGRESFPYSKAYLGGKSIPSQSLIDLNLSMPVVNLVELSREESLLLETMISSYCDLGPIEYSYKSPEAQALSDKITSNIKEGEELWIKTDFSKSKRV